MRDPDKRDKRRYLIQEDYEMKRLSRELAGSLLRELGYEEWEIALFLDNDQTGPE